MSDSFISRLGSLLPRCRKSTRRRTGRSVEALESRTLLATLVSANKLTYQDADGDNVEVAFSKPILTAGNVNAIFTFNTSNVNGSNAIKQQLRTINLTGVAGAAGTTIITKAVRSAANGGDGFAAIGQIDATGIDISTVTIDGDLGRIIAGDATTTTQGLGALTVHSMGRFGTFTGAMNLDSNINGALLSLKSKTDVKDILLDVQGKIGSLTIGGSLLGGAASNSAAISSTGDIGAVIITGDLIGEGAGAGTITTGGKLASVTIGGSLIGSGAFSGQLFSSGDMGAVKIGRDLRGGAGASSGQIRAVSKLASVTIGGSLIGSSGQSSGQVFSAGTLGPVVITGDVRGGSFNAANQAQAAGAVVSNASIASVTIGGSLIGGAGEFSGVLASGLGTAPLPQDMGAVKVTGDVRGGSGLASGRVNSDGKLASLTIGGSLIGSNGPESGSVSSLQDMGAVSIKGDLIGGSITSAGSISSTAKIASVTIGGSLIGGSGDLSGNIFSAGELTTLTINGDIRGGSASGSAQLNESGSVRASRIGTLTLGGSLNAGTDTTTAPFFGNGSIRVTNDIGSLTIKGSIIGNPTNRALITARGQLTPTGTTDLAIGKLTVTGRVEHGLIHAGIANFAFNADAQIGPVVIGGDWIASDLVAGANDGGNGFGNSGDAKFSSGVGAKDVATVSSRITSIVIGGEVLGTVGGTDHFGFVAENIGSFKVKGGTTTFPMLAGNGNDAFFVGLLGDLAVREI